MELIDRYRGALLGLAAGDALGTTLEFRPPGSFAPIGDMLGGGPFGLAPGQWTDDTSMALCLAESIVETRGFDPVDQLQRYVRWWRHGHFASTGECFDIGNTVRAALIRFEQTGEPYCGSTDPRSAGNGSLMRLAPVPLAWRGTPDRAIELAGDSSRTTHGAPEAVDACRYFSGLIVGALGGDAKERLLSDRYRPGPGGSWSRGELSPGVDAVAAGSFKVKSPPAVRGTGYVVESLEAALWAFHHADDLESGALKAVNLGDDADTTGAIYGQLAGAHIPRRWAECLAMRERIEALAADLLAFSESA